MSKASGKIWVLKLFFFLPRAKFLKGIFNAGSLHLYSSHSNLLLNSYILILPPLPTTVSPNPNKSCGSLSRSCPSWDSFVSLPTQRSPLTHHWCSTIYCHHLLPKVILREFHTDQSLALRLTKSESRF